MRIAVKGKVTNFIALRLELLLGELSNLSFKNPGGGLDSISPGAVTSTTRGSSIPRRTRSFPSRIRVTFASTSVPAEPYPPATLRTIRNVTVEFTVARSNAEGSTGISSTGTSTGRSEAPKSA